MSNLIERFTIEGDTLYIGRSNERHGYNLGQLTDRSFNALSILNKHADELEGLTEELRDVTGKLNFLLARTPTDDNLMTFPDGDIWPASQALANKQETE